MIITNKMNLPQSFVSFSEQEYKLSANEYRVTSLLKGIRETILERRYNEQIEDDVSNRIWLILGTAVHSILEQQEEQDHEIKETRLTIDIDEYKLSGQFDLYDAKAKRITDYKTCSVWKVVFGDYSDWRRQLLIYAYMLKSIGFEVNSAEIIAIIKDHSKRDAKFKADYPKLPVTKITFRFSDKDFAEIESWLQEKFAEIKRCESLSDDELPLCTPEERFNSGDKFAVMKKGRKTALRVLDTEDEAETWKEENGGDFIEVRKGEDKKCLDYCNACKFCSHYLEITKEVKE